MVRWQRLWFTDKKLIFYPPSRKDIPHYSFHVRYFRQYISSKLNKYVGMPLYKRFFLPRLLLVSISYRKQCIWKTKLCVCNYVSLCSMLYIFFSQCTDILDILGDTAGQVKYSPDYRQRKYSNVCIVESRNVSVA